MMKVVLGGALAMAVFILATLRFTKRKNPHLPAAEDYAHDPEYILFGASLIAGGQEYLPDWKAAMMREFDASLRPLLEQYYEAAQVVARLPENLREAAAGQHVIVR